MLKTNRATWLRLCMFLNLHKNFEVVGLPFRESRTNDTGDMQNASFAKLEDQYRNYSVHGKTRNIPKYMWYIYKQLTNPLLGNTDNYFMNQKDELSPSVHSFPAVQGKGSNLFKVSKVSKSLDDHFILISYIPSTFRFGEININWYFALRFDL